MPARKADLARIRRIVKSGKAFVAAIECPQCPLARQKGMQCRADYHGGKPMKYPKGKP